MSPLAWNLLTLLFLGGGGVDVFSTAARILGMFSIPNFSHQEVYQVLMLGLAARGHHVTVISPNPLKEPVENYTDVDQSFLYEMWKNEFDATALESRDVLHSLEDLCDSLVYLGKAICDAQLRSPQMQDFLRSKATRFDLVLVERVAGSCLDGVVHLSGSPPVVALHSFLSPQWVGDAVGNPHNPAFAPDALLPFDDARSFSQRLLAAVAYLKMAFTWGRRVLPVQETVLREHFGASPPPLSSSDAALSLVLQHSHWSVGSAVPQLPVVLDLRGLHVLKAPAPLPTELRRFVDGADSGVIYFSLGTNLNVSFLPPGTVNAFLDAFALLPQRVLFKWDSDTPLDNKPRNVMASTWFPQQDILAHSKTKLFITQCGMQSLQEAVTFRVPIVGIPFLNEQKTNMRKMEKEKTGLWLHPQGLSKDVVLRTVRAVLDDPSYGANMARLSEILKDESLSSLEQALWWLEYLLRHSGAPHLRSGATDLHWTRYLLLDVVVAVSTLFAVAIFGVSRRLRRRT